MKIGILTLHYTFNPGGLAQAHCLSKFLNAEIIDYSPQETIDFVNKRKEDNEFFRNCFWWGRKNLRLSPYIFTYKQFIDYTNTFDLIVIGSDEVLKMDAFGVPVKWPSPYYGIGIKTKKILFAAASSPNNDVLNDEQINAINDFDIITVRDKHTLLKLPQYLQHTACIIPDPTFAIKNWYNISGIKSNSKIINKQWNINSQCNNPLDWFSKISSLESAYTNSFHSTIACILGNVEILGTHDNRPKTQELLKEYNCTNRELFIQKKYSKLLWFKQQILNVMS